jgi:hypothetical protein
VHIFGRKEVEDSLADLLGLYTVNDGIHHRRRQKVNIGHDYMDQWRGMLGKAVSHRYTNHGNIKDQNSQNV